MSIKKTKSKIKYFKYKRRIARLKFNNRRLYSAFQEYNFLNFKIIGVFIFLIGLLIIFLYKDESFIKIPSLNTQIFLVEKFLAISSVLIGIIISLIIFSFQIFNRSFGKYAFWSFFQNNKIKFLFTLYVINITYSVYVVSYLKESTSTNHYGVALYILSIILNSLLLLIIFPISFQLIRDSQSKFNIKKVIALLNKEWIYNFDFYTRNEIPNYKIIEKDPIKFLKEIGTQAIINNDSVTIELMLEELELYFGEFIKKNKFKDSSINYYYYENFSELVRYFVPLVIKNDNKYLFYKLLNSRKNLEVYLLKNKLITSSSQLEFSYDGFHFPFEFNEFFSVAVLSNNNVYIEDAIEIYLQFCQYIITDYFPGTFKENIWEKYEDYSKEKFICQDLFITKIENLISLLINSNKKSSFEKAFSLFSLEATVLDSNNSESVKIFILHLLNNSKKFAINEYVNCGIKKITYLNFPYHFVAYEIDKIKRKTIFNSMKEAMNLALKKELLNSMIINSLKALGLHLMGIYDSKTYNKKVLLEVISQFDYLRSLIPKDCNDYQKDIYIKLHKYLTYVQSNFDSLENKEVEIVDLLNKSVLSFNNLSIYEKDLKDIGYITDDSII